VDVSSDRSDITTHHLRQPSSWLSLGETNIQQQRQQGQGLSSSKVGLVYCVALVSTLLTHTAEDDSG
jgi:hypothetical protein